MGDGEPREIGEGPDCQEHQSDEEKRSKNQDAVDHLALGNQVHEISCHKEPFSAGNEQRHADINRAMAERNEGSPHRNERAEEQRAKDEQISADMMAEMVGWMCVAHSMS